MPINLLENTETKNQPVNLLAGGPINLLAKEPSFMSKVGDVAESTVRVGGAVLGGALAFPLSGLSGVVTGLNELFKNAPPLEDLISGKIKLTENQEDELIRRATKKASETIESVQSIPASLIKGEGEQKAVEIISKPFEWIHNAGLYYSDLAVEHGASPAIGALVQGAFETAVLYGMPKLAGKLKGEIKAGKIKKAQETARAIEREKLAKLKAEPKRFEKLVAAEKKVRASVEFENTVGKSAKESAQVFVDRFSKPQTSFGKKVLKTEMMSKAEFQGEGQVSPGMKKPYVPPTEFKGRYFPADPVLPDTEYLLKKATERVGGKYVPEIPRIIGSEKGVRSREGYNIKEQRFESGEYPYKITPQEPVNLLEGEYGLKILDRSIPEPKKNQAQALVDQLTVEGRSAKDSAIIFDEFLRDNQTLKGKIELEKTLRARSDLPKKSTSNPDAKITESYKELSEKSGFSNIPIADIIDKTGLSKEQVHEFIRKNDNVSIAGPVESAGVPEFDRLNAVAYDGKTMIKIKEPEGGTTLSFMGTENAYKAIARELPKLKAAASKAHDIIDVEAPFIREGAKETGFNVKNYFTKRAKIETEAPTIGKRIAEAVKFDQSKLGYETVLAAESKQVLKSIKDPGTKKAAKILHDYFELSKKQYADRGIRIDFKQRIIGDIERKISLTKDAKELAELQKLLNKAKDMEFVHIPSALWFEGKLGSPEGAKGVLKLLVAEKRKTFNIKSLIDSGVVKAKDIKVHDILASYASRKSRDFALLDIVDAAIKDKLAIKIGKGSRVPENFVDVPKTAPILKGYKVHPILSDYIRDITGKGLELGKFQTVLSLSKMASFINPLILPMYDTMQHAMLALVGKWSGKNVKSNMPGYHLARGIKQYVTRSDEYYRAFEEGLPSKPYNNPFGDLQKTTSWAMKNNQQKLLRMAQVVYPWKTISDLYNASWHVAWEMDMAIRMGSYDLLIKQGLSPRVAAQVAALFHGDYASVPAKLRRVANIPFFTPTFKIAMGKLYSQMVKGAIQTPLKAIGLKKNISPRMKFYAAGLAGLIVANTAKNLIMQWHGYEVDQWGRRWKKPVTNEDGKEVESVVTFSDPSNIAQKYIFRALESFTTHKEKPLLDFISSNRWEIHPLWRSMVEALTNQTPAGEKIYSIAEAGSKDQYIKQSWYITKNIIRLFGAFDPDQHDEEGMKLLERETNRAMAVTVKMMAFAYTRYPERTRQVLKLKRFHDEFRNEIIHNAIKGKAIDPKLIEKYRKKAEEMQREQ